MPVIAHEIDILYPQANKQLKFDQYEGAVVLRNTGLLCPAACAELGRSLEPQLENAASSV